MHFKETLIYFRELCAMETILRTQMVIRQTMVTIHLTVAADSVNHWVTFHWCTVPP